VTLAERLAAFVAAVGADIKALNASVAALVAGGDWSRVGLTNDFVNATVTFTDVTGFTCTIPANTNFTIEADLIVAAVATANLPRLGFIWNQALTHGVAEIEQHTSATAKGFTNGLNLAAAGNLQTAVGTAPVAGNYSARAYMKGRTGANACTIKLQLAAETAAANAAILRRGSEFRYRTGP
jgi:hypothetical protein